VQKNDSDEVATVARGRETSKLEIGVLWRLLCRVEACAPSTTLLRRVVLLPPIAVADEVRCAAPSSPSFDPADAADGFRGPEFVVKMS
jgi:hypothetical protein